jgi:hypothetical protein
MASKRRASVLSAACAVVALSGIVSAQGNAPKESPKPFEITDNSFLIEEAFNQDAGVFQNIFTYTHSDDRSWNSTFTQEWPLGGMTHQLSYSLTLAGEGLRRGVGDTLINYRFQALRESRGRPAFSPRVSLVIPGRESDPDSDRGLGVQINLPVSKQVNDIYLHWNAGFTSMSGSGGHGTVPAVGMSGIWRAKPMFHPLLEAVAVFDAGLGVTISPGFRAGWNIGEKQIVVGFALPIQRGDDATHVAALVYGSYELPFKK